MKVVFCLPGANFSGRFLECWTTLVAFCLGQGIQLILSRAESCNIYYVRNMCLGGDVARGARQKPFGGRLDYDYMCWIDSDNLVNTEQFKRLLIHEQEIVAGLYFMEGGKQFATVEKWDEEYFQRNGHFQFLTPDDLAGRQSLMEVAYTGMGFMLVKRGVFESLEYPWFRPVEKRIGDMVDFTMEDVAFCLRAREKGFKIMVDPFVRVGHEKKVTF